MQKELLNKIDDLARSEWGTSLQQQVFSRLEPSEAQPERTQQEVSSKTVLAAAARLIKPGSFLEIGVRRGHSMCLVIEASFIPDDESALSSMTSNLDMVVGIDPWLPGYGGEPNPGPEFVRREIEKFSEIEVSLLSATSQTALPILRELGYTFDLINVDGDHSDEGALFDLRECAELLNSGGILAFDDITHPGHTLKPVWENWVKSVGWESTSGDEGYGWAIAIKP